MTNMQMSNMPSLQGLRLSPPKDGKMGMKFVRVACEDKPVFVKIKSQNIVFEPSVYNGTGEEARKGLVLQLTTEDAKHLQAIEEKIRTEANISSEKWSSCLRESDEGPRLKAKINMFGPKACEFIGPNDEKKAPDRLRGRPATVGVIINGVYMQRNASGLMVDVVAMRYGEVQETEKLPGIN